MTTRLDNTNKNISLFQTFSEFLKDVWKNDEKRDWSIYSSKEQFAYFWDNRDVVDRQK